jgi:oligogalacturonide lyase
MRSLRHLVISTSLLTAAIVVAQVPMQNSPTPPKTWVDKDTGHRVWRLTDEPGSSAFYFNVNDYSPDKRFMIYTAPDGIHTLELANRKTRLLVPNPAPQAGAAKDQSGQTVRDRTVVVGHKTDSVFFTRFDLVSGRSIAYKADMISGEVTKLATLPVDATIATINADETLAAGVYDDDKGANAKGDVIQEQRSTQAHASLVQPEGKGAMMERRLAARTPVVLFTIELATGKVHELLHSTDWIGHMLFSPIDPSLLMYCHEGPWQKVDRIWTIHTDGTHNTLMHKRTMLMEIAGHEFWGQDGETIWYDWQFPKGEDFWLAGLSLKDGTRVAYHMLRDEWSIHFNVNDGATLFCGDGGDPGQVAHAPDGEWINLFHPEWARDNGGIDDPSFIKPGILHVERLVNMRHHNYRLEPNVRFSPDSKLVIFTSNMFGPSYVFAAEIDKAPTDSKDVASTPDLGRKYGPDPVPTNCSGTKDSPCNGAAR